MNEGFAVRMALLLPLGALYCVISVLLLTPPGWRMKLAFIAVAAILMRVVTLAGR